MNYGSLKTLYTALTAAPSLATASVVFGEENINAQDAPVPMVCIVPIGGSWNNVWDAPGYGQNMTSDVSNVWMTQENIDLYLWAYDLEPGATEIDHADAVENLRAAVLQALQYQAPTGQRFIPQSGRWAQMRQASARYGRSYILTVQVDITVTDVLPVDVTVQEVTLNPISLT